MAAEKPTQPQSREVVGSILSYRAVVQIRRYRGEEVTSERANIHDRELAERLRVHPGLQERLNIEARRLFGSAFRVSLLDIRTGSSAELVLVLYAEDRTTVTLPAFRERTIRFCETIREAIRLIVDEGLYDLEIDVEPEGEVFPEPPATPRSGWDRVSPVLAAVAGGIGVLGFVTFVGAAIEFAHLHSAGLPAEEALAVIPTANLVTIGARVLVPALALALLAAAFVYVWERAAAWYRARARLRKDPVGKESLVTRRVLVDKVSKPPLPPKPELRAAVLAGVILAMEVAKFAFDRSDSGELTTIAFLILAPLTFGAVYVVALRTRAFLSVAATAFIAVGLFAGTMEYFQASDSLRVRPAAVIRSGDTTIGFFIAETSSQVYLGRLEEFTEPVNVNDSRILILPKDETDDISIGPLMDPTQALERAQAMAHELCAIRPHAPLRLIAKEPGRKRTECDRTLLRAKHS